MDEVTMKRDRLERHEMRMVEHLAKEHFAKTGKRIQRIDIIWAAKDDVPAFIHTFVEAK